MSELMNSLAYGYGQPLTTGRLKVEPEHFVVKEVLGFEFAGQGEHFMVQIRKRGENTKYVVNELAKACGVKSRDVSWAGLKDRHAVTEQWLSVHLPGKEDPCLEEFVATHPGVEVLATARHDKKLRPGDLSANQFEIVVTELNAETELEQKLQQIAMHGVPNYFGEQRFGREGNNLVSARAWGNDEFRVRDKSKRSFYLSAARSWIFNLLLSHRLTQSTASSVSVGDILAYQDGREVLVESLSSQADVDAGLAGITGPLTGDNAFPTAGDVAVLENQIAEQEPLLLKVIRDNRMRHDRRPLMLKPEAMRWERDGDRLTIAFTLAAGSFATAVMRELIVQGDIDG
ncbi:tRNA pseudouridine(13) synthase TruD [Thaumasiovibrio subtropicus]|uniref:tRNA pseudouridine(13) synthase TruD n=1 Tax=Thaumasiovibrio subtropicus TaxID=1891207 RepID=UPI000B358F8F|nr:tRNA pseudouridine(13) synthase TruD [Thaumasiovibrio subtropicus]